MEENHNNSSAEKNSNPVSPNNFRPIALTSILCKCMEGVVLRCLSFVTVCSLLIKLRGTEDATLNLSTYARILFIDLSSVFNTVRTNKLLNCLLKLDINGHMVLWIKDF